MSELCLGTVQFGMKYGINNKFGKPSKQSVFEMIDIALERGIEYFDTAMAYGDAEDLLGEYLQIRKPKKNIHIISKLKPNIIDDHSINVKERIEAEIKKSLERLKIEKLDGYLLHTPTYFYNQEIVNALLHCKGKGLVKNIGVSIYETEHALDVVSSGIMDYIQVPYSVFDQRLDQTDFFQIAQKNNVKVFGRSAFLQGLMMMKKEEIPDHLAHAKGYLKKFDDIINRFGFNRLEATFRFSYEKAGMNYVVFGVDNMGQLKEDIELKNVKADFSECRKELEKHFLNVEKSIIFPSLWAKKEN